MKDTSMMIKSQEFVNIFIAMETYIKDIGLMT